MRRKLGWAIVGCCGLLVAFGLIHARTSYQRLAIEAEEACGRLAHLDETVTVRADQIDCKLVHDDWIVTFRVDKTGEFGWGCLPDRRFRQPFGVRDCSFYRRVTQP